MNNIEKHILLSISLLILSTSSCLHSMDIWKAAEMGSIDRLRELIHEGADINAIEPHIQETPLHLAAGNGHEKIVEELIAAKAQLDFAEPRSGNTPLFAAVFQGHANIVKILLMAGANANAINFFGLTPLFVACNGQIIRLLVGAKADVNHRNNIGATPLHWANNADVIDALLEAGADRYSRDTIGNTALHVYVHARKYTNAKALIDKGFDVNRVNALHDTPLHLLVHLHYSAIQTTKECERNIIRILIQAGAQLDIEDKNHQTPIQVAQKTRPYLVPLLTKYANSLRKVCERVPLIAGTLAMANHQRLGIESSLSLVTDRFLLHDLVELTRQAEEHDARQPQ